MAARPDGPDIVYAPFVWQETGFELHHTTSGPTHVVFAHGSFMAKKTPKDENSSKQLRRLANNLPNCTLPEFVRLFGTVAVQPSGAVRAVLTELCPFTLHEFIHFLNFKPSREVLTSMVLDIANAVLHMHQRNMLHGELVPLAILVTTNCGCKIGDLGAPPAPTNAYIAPEVKAGSTPSPKADVFSFGVTVAELASGVTPEKADMEDILDAIEWEPLCVLLQKCLVDKPQERPDMKEVADEIKRYILTLCPGRGRLSGPVMWTPPFPRPWPWATLSYQMPAGAWHNHW